MSILVALRNTCRRTLSSVTGSNGLCFSLSHANRIWSPDSRSLLSTSRIQASHSPLFLNAGRICPDGRRSMAKKGAKGSRKEQEEESAATEESVIDTTHIITEMTEVTLFNWPPEYMQRIFVRFSSA